MRTPDLPQEKDNSNQGSIKHDQRQDLMAINEGYLLAASDRTDHYKCQEKTLSIED